MSSPEESSVRPPFVPPDPAPAVPCKATYIFTLISDVDGCPPEIVESASMEQMIQELYVRMLKAGSGWVYPVVNGERAVVSAPRQLFKLKLADGAILDVCDPAALAFDANGRFSVLKDQRV
jgi:hypothetical protein